MPITSTAAIAVQRKESLASFSDAVKQEVDAISAYKSAIKNLAAAVKTAAGAAESAIIPTVNSAKDFDTVTSFMNQVDPFAGTGELDKLQQDLDAL